MPPAEAAVLPQYPTPILEPQRNRITEKAIEVMSSLEDRKGRLQPNDVLEEAENVGSPLHPFFEWDDSVAAQAYRLEQARVLIGRFKITVIIEEREIVIPKYIRDVKKPHNEQGYIQTTKVRKDNIGLQLAQELGGAISLLNRALSFAESRAGQLPDGTVDRVQSLIGETSELINNLT